MSKKNENNPLSMENRGVPEQPFPIQIAKEIKSRFKKIDSKKKIENSQHPKSGKGV